MVQLVTSGAGPAGACHGNGVDHCCYVAGDPCLFVEKGTVPGRMWACGLLRELGSWDAVHTDERYTPIRVLLEARGVPELCGGFGARQGQCCYAEGE